MMLPVVLASRVEVRLVFGLVFAVFWALLHEQLHPWRPSTKTITLPRAKRSMRITTDGFAGALVWLVVGIYLLAALIYVLPEKVMSVAIGRIHVAVRDRSAPRAIYRPHDREPD